MIKTNLLKSKVPVGQADQTQDYVFEGEESSVIGSQGEQILKLLVMFLCTAMLIGYEYYNLGEKEGELKVVKSEETQLSQELSTLKSKMGDPVKIKKEIDEMNEKIELIQALSKKRLKELKSLDYLQNIIPDGIWLKTIDYDGSVTSIEGSALTDRDLNSFVENLELSAYFKEVLLLSSSKVANTDGTIKSFRLSSEIGESL